jgi:hypothetical protein
MIRQQPGVIAARLQQGLLTPKSGAAVISEDHMLQRVSPTARNDFMAFVPRTTSARPTPTGHQPQR